MARVGQPASDGHARSYPTGAHLGLVFVPETQQGGMTIRHSQFPRHGGDGEQRRQAFYPLPPIEMSRFGQADEMITRQLPVFFRPFHRKPQLQGRVFGRKSRLQPPDLLVPALPALDGGVDFGDFIPLPQSMHRRPADSQHPPDFGVGFVQVPADEFEPLNGQGTLPLQSRFGLHRPAVIYALFAGNSSIIAEDARKDAAQATETQRGQAATKSNSIRKPGNHEMLLMVLGFLVSSLK